MDGIITYCSECYSTFNAYYPSEKWNNHLTKRCNVISCKDKKCLRMFSNDNARRSHRNHIYERKPHWFRVDRKNIEEKLSMKKQRIEEERYEGDRIEEQKIEEERYEVDRIEEQRIQEEREESQHNRLNDDVSSGREISFRIDNPDYILHNFVVYKNKLFR
jgi:hypothetical protein